jgi:hypothetical protein
LGRSGESNGQNRRFLVSSHIRPDARCDRRVAGGENGFSTEWGKGPFGSWIRRVGSQFDRFYSKDELILFDPTTSEFSETMQMVMVDAGEWVRWAVWVK